MNKRDVMSAFAALPSLGGELPYHTWHRHRLSLREHVATGDLENMLKWSTIVATMFVGTGAAFTPLELSRLSKRYLDAIHEPRVGNPELYDGWTSGNLIHQAYHLMQWEKLGKSISDLDSIVEIGGGYGAMALLCHRLGFDGTYIIADLPELRLLQEYYLGQCGVTGVQFVAVDDLRAEPDLLIALYSITEMETEERWKVMENVKPQHLLLCHQPGFTPFKGYVDNVAWSEEMVERYGGTRYGIDLPMLAGHWYVVR